MSQFIYDETIDTDSNNSEEDEEERGSAQESNFFDEETFFNDRAQSNNRLANGVENFEESACAYATNVTCSYEEAMALSCSKDEECGNDICNFLFWDEPPYKEDVDKAKITQSRITKFEKTLEQKCEKSKDSLFNAVLWGAYFKVKTENPRAYVDDEELKKVLGVDFVDKFMKIKDNIVLDINLDTFEHKMHLVNDLLDEKNMFLRLKKPSLGIFLKKVMMKMSCKRRSVLASSNALMVFIL